MPRACSIKKLSALVLAMILGLSATGCQNSSIAGISKGEWISKIIAEAGMEGHLEDEPYFMNINAQSEYFNDIQTAVEWHIIDPAYPFDPDEMLSREWAAFTLVNLGADLPEGNPSVIKDSSKTMFSDQVASAVASGLMKTDGRNMFHPKKIMDKEEALKCLDQVIDHINHRKFDENIFNISWKDDLNVYETEPLNVDPETMTATVSDSFEAQEGDVIYYPSGIGEYETYRITGREGNEVTLEECDLSDEVEEVEMQGSVEVDFTKIKIYDGNGNLIQDRPTGNNENDHITLMSKKETIHHYEQNGFEIETRTSQGSFTCEAVKKINGGKVYADLNLSGIKIDYYMKTLLFAPKKTYWHMDFTSSESMGVKAESKVSKAADFSKLNRDNFLSSLGLLMQDQEDAVQTEFTLAKMIIPTGVPADIVVDVSLVLKTSGKAEIVLTQKNNFGYEFVDGNLRVIKECDHKQNLNLKAESSIYSSFTAALVSGPIRWLDTKVNAGAKASVSTKIHLFDDEGKKQTVETDASADLADELAAKTEDVVVCADASGNWMLDLIFFSKGTAAYTLLGEKKVTVLDAKNAPLFKGSSQHFENWQAVDHCTRKDREKHEKREVMETKGKISLDNYSLAVGVGQNRSISVLGLPAGYSMSDLTAVSSDPSIATVSGLTVTGVSSGSAVITITTADGSFQTACNILVPQVNGKGS